MYDTLTSPSPSQLEAAAAIRALPEVGSEDDRDGAPFLSEREAKQYEEESAQPAAGAVGAPSDAVAMESAELLRELVATQQRELAAQHLEIKRLQPQLKAAEGECQRLGGHCRSVRPACHVLPCPALSHPTLRMYRSPTLHAHHIRHQVV